MPTINPIPEFVIDLNLSPEERFHELGYHCRTDLGDLLNEIRKGFTSEVLEWSPMITRKAVDSSIDMALSFIRRSLCRHEYMRELEGLADAADIDVNNLLFGNLIYDLTAGFKVPGIGCTGFVHGGPKSPLIARAMDWSFPEGIGEKTMVLRYQGGSGSDSYEILTVGFPGFNGVISGISSEGVALTVNQRTMDDYFISTPNWETPTLWRTREVLENSTDYYSAYRMICKKAMASPAFFLMCGTEPEEACMVMSDGVYQEHVDVREETSQVISNHVPGAEGPWLDFDDATSVERFDALYVGTQGMRTASTKAAKNLLGEWPVECERTVQQMVLCPAEKIMHLRCPDIDPRYHIFRTI
jgi:hypothetical protein